MTDVLRSRPAPDLRWTWRSALVLATVLLCSWLARETLHRRVYRTGTDRAHWITCDPDSLYQMRRVERTLAQGLPVAGRDPLLNHPHGSAIPWPPYYTLVVATLLRPFAPDEASARHAWIERRVASLPLVFGVLTSLVAALAARRLWGDLAALVAGSYHALCLASIAYSKAGNGDHHAWVALLAGLLLWILSTALARGALRRPAAGLAWGSALGAVAGLALGSWVASLVHVLEVQLVLAWLILRNGRAHLPGLAALGLAFHLAALAVSLPAVAASPWRELNPWQVVNLSWFHPLFLAAGAAVFAPLPLLRDRPRSRRAYPLAVLILLALVGAAVATLDAAPAAGIREGFEWMNKVNQFMAGIGESRPLFGARAGARALSELGYALLALPVVWALLVWSGRKGLELALLPFLVSAPLRAVQAARQARFGDALVLPLSVLLAVGVAWLAARAFRDRRARIGALAWPLAAGLVLLSHARVGATLLQALRGERAPQALREGPAALAVRGMCEWLAANGRRPGAVLATWSFGHVVEWAAGRATLATNFGSYVGEEGFRDAPRFLLSTDEAEARGILDASGVGYVLVTSLLPRTLSSQIAAAGPELRARFLQDGPGRTDIRPEWFETFGARLLFDGVAPTQDPHIAAGLPLEELRLVHVSGIRDPGFTLPPGLSRRTEPSPAGFLWERVPGAVLRARGTPGARLTLRLELRYPAARYTLEYVRSAVADDSGEASLRVPYATDAHNGDGRVVAASAQFSLDDTAQPLAIPLVIPLVIPERAVLGGGTVELPQSPR